jgi:hypothetical protein
MMRLQIHNRLPKLLAVGLQEPAMPQATGHLKNIAAPQQHTGGSCIPNLPKQ